MVVINDVKDHWIVLVITPQYLQVFRLVKHIVWHSTSLLEDNFQCINVDGTVGNN